MFWRKHFGLVFLIMLKTQRLSMLAEERHQVSVLACDQGSNENKPCKTEHICVEDRKIHLLIPTLPKAQRTWGLSSYYSFWHKFWSNIKFRNLTKLKLKIFTKPRFQILDPSFHFKALLFSSTRVLLHLSMGGPPKMCSRCEGGPLGQSCPSARVVLCEGGP